MERNARDYEIMINQRYFYIIYALLISSILILNQVTALGLTKYIYFGEDLHIIIRLILVLLLF